MFVITGATGNIGSKIAHRLLDEGHPVRVIGRNAKRLQPFVDMGAEAAVGDLEDTKFLTKAFTGATAVYAMIPPTVQADNFRNAQNKIGESICNAIKKAKVKHVVNLSSIGTHLTERSGVLLGLHDQEERLNKLTGVNVLHLRAGYFMENTLMAIDQIRNTNAIATAIRGEVPLPMVATTDIADVATDFLTNRNFEGKALRNVLGPRDVNYSEVANVLGNAIGIKNLNYNEVPYDLEHDNLINMGLSDSYANGIVDLSKVLNDGTALKEIAKRTPDTTTTTHTTIEDFAQTFSQHYKK